ncbi:hypothetical protein Q7P37_007653 [Cladosporium fusiforme]
MHIVSLGSSFASGPSIQPVTNPVARRSGSNYPSLLARALSARLTDLSASGATLLNILDEPQECLLGILPPQLEGLPADADVITLTAGGNDLGYSAGMMSEAARLTIEDANFLDVVLESMGLKKDGANIGVSVGEVQDRFVRIFDAIRAKAPQAQIFLVEYLSVFGPATTLTPTQPLSPEQVSIYKQMAADLRQAYRDAAAKRQGVEVIPIVDVSETHALGSEEPWMEGFTKEMLMTGHAPFHPNAAGHVGVAREVEKVVRRRFEI